MLLIFLVVLVCPHASLLIHWLLLQRTASSLVIYTQILLVNGKLQVPFSISHLLDQTSVMLPTKSVSLCIFLLRAIGLRKWKDSLLSNVSYGTWKVHLPLAFTSLEAPLYHCIVLLVLTGWGVLMIENLLVATLSFSAPLPSHENLVSNARYTMYCATQ